MSPDFRHYLGKKRKLRTKRASISALVSLLQDQKSVIERVRQDTVSICENRSLQSGLTTDANGQVSSENYSMFNSSIGHKNFSFDDEIINSFAYRVALKRLASKSKATLQNAKPDERHILDEPLIDLEEVSQTHNRSRINSKGISNDQCLTPTMTSTHTPLIGATLMEDLKSLIPTSNTLPSQQLNEGHADVTSPSCSSGSPMSASVNQRDKNTDVEKVIMQRIGDGICRETHGFHTLLTKPVQASAEPFRHSNQSTDITADAVENFDKYVTLPIAMRSVTCCSDVTRSSIVPEKSEIPSALEEERQRARLFVEQAARGEPPVVSPPSSTMPVSVSGAFDTCRSNVAPIVSGSARDEAEAPCDYATSCYERQTGRDGGHQDRLSETKASEDKVYGNSLVTEHDYVDINPSTEAVTNFRLNSSRQKKRRGLGREIPTAEGLTVTPLTAAALKNHEREFSPSIHDTRSCPSRQKYRKRRVKDKIQHSRHDASLIENSKIRAGDEAASNPSIEAYPGLLDTVENAIRRLRMPELEPLRQEQRKKEHGQTPEPSYLDFCASPETSADLAYQSSKDASASDASENPKPIRDENNSDVCEGADSTTDIPHNVECTSFFIAEDVEPVTIPTRKHGSGILTPASQNDQTSLLTEYFEGGRGSNIHPRPSVHVNVRPSSAREIEDMNGRIQVTASNRRRKSFSKRMLPLLYPSGERQAKVSADDKSGSSHPRWS